MAILLKLLSAYTVLVALLVAVKFIFAVDQPEWALLNWLMAAGVIITLGGAISCKRQLEADGAGGDVRRFLDVNVPFYAAVALLIAFGFQWFSELGDHVQLIAIVDGEDTAISSMWAYIDTAYIVVTGMIGVRMWNGRWPMGN